MSIFEFSNNSTTQVEATVGYQRIELDGIPNDDDGVSKLDRLGKRV